jgi:hypothetical protein
MIMITTTFIITILRNFLATATFLKPEEDKNKKEYYVIPGSWRPTGLLNPVDGGSRMSRYLETMRTETK